MGVQHTPGTTRRRAGEAGTTASEYALVLAGLATVVVVAFSLLSPAVVDLFAGVTCRIAGECADLGPAGGSFDPWDDPDPVRRATWGDVVVLGDSFSSGEGAGDYGAAVSAVGCHASEHGYGPLLASRFDIGHGALRIAACTGATISHLAGRYADHRQPPQLGAIDGDTSMVALSIGGNDVGWGPALADCVQQTAWSGSSDCTPGSARARALEAGIDGVGHRLRDALRTVAARAPHARVVALGYPRFFPDAADEWLTWAALPAFSPDSQRWANAMTDRLNQVVATAATQAGVEFVDAGDAFSGHELTSDDPWFHGVDLDPTIGRAWGVPVPSVRPNPASFHPTADGQRALADLMERQIRFPRRQD